ncbi:MAG: hypothetical protein GW905_03560 [Rhodobacterales bacterium]|nr:hypothetical protein [Rhodobacterales bacterium]
MRISSDIHFPVICVSFDAQISPRPQVRARNFSCPSEQAELRLAPADAMSLFVKPRHGVYDSAAFLCDSTLMQEY